MKVVQRVIFVHGAGGGSWEWECWLPLFAARGFHTAALDLVPAPAGLAATRFEDYLEQVIAWAGAGEPPVLVGASLGGLLALKAAERAPAAALILVNSIPPVGTPGWPPRARRFPDVVPWSSGALDDTRVAMPDADEQVIRRAHARWRDESGRVMRVLYDGIAVAPAPIPTLAVLGRDDTEVPAQVGIAAAQALSADLMVFASVSHVGALLGQRAGIIARLACEWLAAVLAEKPASARA